ncbi:MAG: hypothetical protein ABH840_04690 [Nanoarchaeota archaeon]
MELYTKSYASYQSIDYLLRTLQKTFDLKKRILPKHFRKGLDKEKTTYISLRDGQLLHIEPIYISSQIKAATLISVIGSEKNAKSLARQLEPGSGISQDIVPVPELEGMATGRLAGFSRIYKLETRKFQPMADIIEEKLDYASAPRSRKKR